MGAAAALAGLGLLGAALGGAFPASGHPKAGGTSPMKPVAAKPSSSKAVTLITGDRVLFRDNGVAQIIPGKGREDMRFITRKYDGHLYVTPIDVAGDVSSGRLDSRLFDITGLEKMGYTDDRRKDLPLIVEGGNAPESRNSNVKAVRRLAALNARAVRLVKGDGTFWRTTKKAGGKIWLDGKLRLNLDKSVPQIGAPEMWKSGYTGKGITVGVLDSGADGKHPDLTGQVLEQKNFLPPPPGNPGNPGSPGSPANAAELPDPVGHGTHVSATIASKDKRYRGVAPDAKLVVGQVCDANGGCAESAAIAAMQWAAAEKHAKVVNMSFGGPAIPGGDPMEEAVNALTKKYGTLFVSGAGNDGREGGVGSPATADAALAVGAVNAKDLVTGFSSRGPRPGDFGLKPDVTAPGLGIVAALAKGSRLDEGLGWTHIKGTGTSMASPHAAGAAALLFQQHPEWTPAQVKAALMGSAKPSEGAGAFDQGAGRIDLSKAVGVEILPVNPSIGFGIERWPHDDDKPATKVLTYQNTTDKDVRLALKATATGPGGGSDPGRGSAADGVFAIDKSRLTVPANGTASVEVTANTKGDRPDGNYTGRVIATGSDGSVVGTPLSVVREKESYDLTVRAIGRDGKPVKEFRAGVLEYNEAFTGDAEADSTGTARVRVPRGDYAVDSAIIQGADPEKDPVDLVVRPWLRVRSDQTIVLDARTAKRGSVKVERKDAELVHGLVGYAEHIGDGALMTLQETGDMSKVGMGQIGPDAPAGKFVSVQQATMIPPGESPAYTYNLAWFTPDKAYAGPRTVRDKDLAKVATTLLSQGKTTEGGEGTIAGALGARWAPAMGFPLYPVKLGTTRLNLYNTEGNAWQHAVLQGKLPGPDSDVVPEAEQFRPRTVYRAGRTYREVWNGQGVFGPSLPWPVEQTEGPRTVPDLMLFKVPLFGSTATTSGNSRTDKVHTTIHRDGELVCESGRNACSVDEPVAGRYTARITAERSLTDMSTKVDTTWRFGTDGKTGILPVQVVRYDPKLDAKNTAPGGRAYTVPVAVQRNPGASAAKVASLKVWASYDDGRTWRRAPIVNGRALLRHPEQGYVSLRAKAVDTAGNAVDQTIVHAYKLR